MASLKRKLVTDRGILSPVKKQKPSTHGSVTITLKPPSSKLPLKPFASAPIPMPNACPDYPNGFIYCHQCSKKRDVTDAIQCTFLETHQNMTKEKDKDLEKGSGTNDDDDHRHDGGMETDGEHHKEPNKDKDKTKAKVKDKDKDKDKSADKSTPDKPPRQRRCVGKFCKFCLKNRYDLDFDDVVTAARSNKKELGHIDTAGYIFKCPKCSETCNCPRCRKSKGLEPMGSAGTIRKPPPEPTPKPSAADKSNGNSKGGSRKSKKGTDNSSSSASGKGTKTGSGGKNGATSTTTKKPPKPKPLPVAKWTPVPISTQFTLEDAEARFHIREFVLRFADLMEPTLPKTNLEELEEVGGGRHQGRERDLEGSGGEEGGAGEMMMISWVSEFCVKSIVVGLLNLIAKELHGAIAAAIKSAVKEIRSLGVNLNKIWPVLASLRELSLTTPDDPSHHAHHNQPDSLSTTATTTTTQPPTLPGTPHPRRPFTFTFPDPLPPPHTHETRHIRSTRLHDSSTTITYSAQMVPVLTALIEDALLTSAVREEIERGVRESRELVKEQREAVKREAERWEVVRKGMETRVKVKAQILENRAKREYHKHKLVSLENALKILAPRFAARFAPVGIDEDERVYWIISPGAAEREAALEFIGSCASDERFLSSSTPSLQGGKRGAGVGVGGRRSAVRRLKVLASEEERAEMKSWSWFVVVYGKKPLDAAPAPGSGKSKSKSKAKTPTVNGNTKGGEKREEVKLKIKVSAQARINANANASHAADVETKKKKKEKSEDDMDVDELRVDNSGRDEDEEMASASDQDEERARRNWDSPTSSSRSDSEDEGEGEGDASGSERDGDENNRNDTVAAVSDQSDSDEDGEDEERQSESDEENEDEEAEVQESGDDEESREEVDDGRERWWGFYDPLEILKLSDWIAYKAGLDEEQPPATTTTTDNDGSNNDPASTASLLPPSSRASSSTVVPPNGTSTPPVHHEGSSISSYTANNGNNISSSSSGPGAGQKSRDTSVTVTITANHHDHSSPRPPARSYQLNNTGSGSGSGGNGKKAQMKNLVDELRTFASLLEWRCREDKYELILRDLAAAAGGAASGSANVSANVSVSGSVVNGESGSGSGGKGKLKIKAQTKERESRDGRSISVSSFYGSR